ncbi:MAG: peptidoglycan D,D-transpeptidase FtsI family protein [Thermodesulfobacteriota bacterium]
MRSGFTRDWMRFRFFLFIVVILIIVTAILFQAYRIQVHHGEELRREVQGMYQREITLLPARGSIFDRNGDDLAISIPVDSIYARPKRVEDPVATSRKLAPLLDIDHATILNKLRQQAPFVWIKRQVVPTVSARVRALGLSGIGVLQETRRFYPNLELASHLMGFVGVDGQGMDGLEYQYDKLLRGEKSRILVDQDALGRPLASPEGLVLARKDGYHLVLTIHKEIQHIVERRLQEGVESSRSRGGMAVVMDPQTGEVLAMATAPRFNPNTYAQYPKEVLRNRCVTDTYEPGSAFKPFVVAAAIENRIWKPTDVFYCENGSYRVFDKVIHDVHRYGHLTLRGIIQKSSNIGAAKVGLSIGAERLYSHLLGFGFGRPTGVDLPGETPGLVRPPKWAPVELANISFGQGISVNALQLTAAFAALGNDGRLMRPYVVREILDAQGNTVERRGPQEIGLAVSPETARQVTQILKAVVSQEGTGAQAALEGFEVAGKTGTAQKADLRHGGYMRGRYMASFVGFVPANDPRLCLLVVMDEPQGNIYGGQVAAPTFREIARDALGVLGVYPGERFLARGQGSHSGESAQPQALQ